MRDILLLLLLLSTSLLSLDTKVTHITKDGVYLDIGRGDNIKVGDILYSTKDKRVKLKIKSLSESHSLACLLDKDSSCNYNIDKMLKIKRLVFKLKEKDTLALVNLAGKKDKDKKKDLFIRDDKENFEEITQKDMDLFNNNEKIFKLVIFDLSTQKREIKKYQLYGSISFYNMGKIELLEKYHTLNSLLSTDLTYETKNQRFEALLDIDNRLDKDFDDLSLNIYQFNYYYKYKNFKFKVGRDSLEQLNNFYIVDGLFLDWKRNHLKAGTLLTFGVDYYNSMKTDFKHIYTGGYFGIDKMKLSDKISYNFLVALIPELIYNKKLFFGAIPLYFNTRLYYGKFIDLLYQFKVTNTLLGENLANGKNKNFYFNHYIALNINPTKKIALRLGFDSRDYLDLINKSYYNKTIIEKIDNDVTKNIYTNFTYRLGKDLLLLSYKYRFKDDDIDASKLITIRYLMRFRIPLELSLRETVFISPEVNKFFTDINVNYIFKSDWRLGGNLVFELEKVTLLDDKAVSITPQIEIYKKFSSYFYLKSNFSFEVAAKRIDLMFKVGYIFK